MQSLNQATLNRIINDKELTSLFIDYLAENLKMTLSSHYAVDVTDYEKFQQGATESLGELVRKLKTEINPANVDLAIAVVCNIYLSSVFPKIELQSDN